ncbi:MAG: hypothetical protein ACFE0I_18985 [Elainellaceae cyanobacterium]
MSYAYVVAKAEYVEVSHAYVGAGTKHAKVSYAYVVAEAEYVEVSHAYVGVGTEYAKVSHAYDVVRATTNEMIAGWAKRSATQHQKRFY